MGKSVLPFGANSGRYVENDQHVDNHNTDFVAPLPPKVLDKKGQKIDLNLSNFLASMNPNFQYTPVRGKGPYKRNWNRNSLAYNYAKEEISKGSATGVGLVHEHSGTCSLDIDNLAKAKEFLKQEGINLDVLLNSHEHFKIYSPKKNRAKIIFLIEQLLETKQFKDADGCVIFELRCKGAQDIWPGSSYKHSSGLYEGSYTHGGSVVPVLIPKTLKEFWYSELQKKTSTKLKWQIDIAIEDEATIARAVEYCNKVPPAISGNGGDNHTYKIFCHLKNIGLNPETAKKIFNHYVNPRCIPTWGEGDIHRICSSAYRNSQSPQGCLTYPLTENLPFSDNLKTTLVNKIKKKIESRVRGSSFYFNVEVLERSVSGAFYNGINSKVYAINCEGELPLFTLTEYVNDYRQEIFGYWFYKSLKQYLLNQSISDKEIKKTLSDLNNIANQEYKRYLVTYRQRSVIRYRTCMFVTTSKLQVEKEYVELIRSYRPFHEGEINKEIVKDYKMHFPAFDTFLEFVCAARFASDRKKAFLWLHAPSDWGKGFLMSVFGSLGIVTEMSVKEIEKAFEGAPVGKQPQDFIDCWILVVDEFKTVRSEIKQLASEIKAAPKNQMTFIAPVYAKLFMSAEEVPSLAGSQGVEDQFSRRFSTVEVSKNRIDDRELFKESKTSYLESIKNYAAKKLNDSINFYRELGERKAKDHADKYLEEYNVKHNISSVYGALEESAKNTADEIRDLIFSISDQYGVSANVSEPLYRLIKKSVIKCEFKGHSSLLIKSPDRIISDYIKEHIEQSEQVKLNHKKTEIKKYIDDSGRVNLNSVIRVTYNGVPQNAQKGILIKL